ncbi:MAG: four helix bundle protein [Deltaproteobacteria bacterium]|nr:four helix bundle protein [Deltaproteobacteria bacterium]MBI2974906.1 four helix bundle protein [Deltaproteobacteria bacterium]
MTRRWPYYLSDQFKRATSSVVLNIAEGNGRLSPKERRRFFN